MQPAENKDYSRDVILRLSPTRNTIIVEEQKPGGIAAYREIDPLELYYVINQSYGGRKRNLGCAALQRRKTPDVREDPE